MDHGHKKAPSVKMENSTEGRRAGTVIEAGNEGILEYPRRAVRWALRAVIDLK